MTSTQTKPAGNGVDVPRVSAQRSRWTLVAVALATFMTYLDNNIVNVAIPVIERDLHLTTSGLEWVVSSYILVFASLLLAGGRLADVWGRKRLFLIGLSVFTAASLAAGLAGNVDVLVISRAVQGLGAALVTPTTLAIISATFANPRQRAAAVGIWSGVSALALAVGPLLGGVLSQYLSWGWIFFVNVPVGLATLALGAVAIRESRDSAGPRRLDLPGVITSAGALFALTFALIEGHDRGWTSPVILSSFAVAAVLGVVFVRLELRVSQPMVSLSLFRKRVFSGGLIALMMWGFGLFGIYFFTSLYLQGVLGFSPTKAGAAFVPMALLMAAGSVISERVSHRLGAYRVVGAAMLLMAAGVASVSLLGADADFASLMPSFAVIGIGGGLTVPLTASVLDAMPREEAGVASGIFNASREVSGLLGITVIGAVLTARQSVLLSAGQSPVDAFLGGYRAGLLLAAALVALGGVAAYIGLRRRTAGRHAYTNAPAAEAFSVPGPEADTAPAAAGVKVETSVVENIVRFESHTVIQGPVSGVFERLADLPGYGGWMHRSGLFRRCSLTSEVPIRRGTTYVDSTRMGTFDGEVTEFVPPTRIAFRETLHWFGSPMTQARPEYTLEGDETTTIVHHVAVGELYGWMRFMKPAAAWMANRERTRTLNSLKRSLESD